MKKVLSIVAIIVGALLVIGGVAPMIIGAILEAQIPASVGVIGGADGPTAVLVVGSLGIGSVVTEILIGAILIVAGIWGYRKGKHT